MPRRVPSLVELVFPARDEDFGALVSRFSEPTNAPRGDNFVSNEDSYPRIVGELARSAPRDGVYLGVGPDQNFTMIAAARPSLAFILDYRRRNLLVHLLHKAIFSLAKTRVDYLGRLFAREPVGLREDSSGARLSNGFGQASLDRARLRRMITDVERLSRPMGVVREEEWRELATIQARIAGPGIKIRFLAHPIYPTLERMIETTDREGRPAHMLATESSFQGVRSLQNSDRVIPVVANFAGTRAIASLARWIRERGFTVGVLYVSDVEFFLLRSGQFEAYLRNLERLPWSTDALIVRTSTREINHSARVPGDHSTTVIQNAREFIDRARSGKIQTPDDLFP